MEKKLKVSLFVPVYNEEKIIEKNTEQILNEISKLPYDFELIIVDDSSTDGSSKILERLSRTTPNLIHLRYENGPTRRENLAQSFKKAKGEIVAFMDMDLAANLKHFPELIKTIKQGYDIVTGSRYVKGAKTKRKLSRWVISHLYNLFVRLYFKTKIRDHECGFKAFKKNIIIQLVDEMGFDKTLKRGVAWDTEMLVRALRHSYTIREIPIIWNEGKKSELHFSRDSNLLLYLLRLKKRLKNKYI